MPASATLLPDSTTSAIPLAKATLSATRFILFSTLIFIPFRTHRPGDWRRSPVGGNACSQITDAVATPTAVSTEIIFKLLRGAPPGLARLWRWDAQENTPLRKNRYNRYRFTPRTTGYRFQTALQPFSRKGVAKP
jgi:hypothetical protein